MKLDIPHKLYSNLIDMLTYIKYNTIEYKKDADYLLWYLDHQYTLYNKQPRWNSQKEVNEDNSL